MDLQNYLLATTYLKDTIEESLDLAVGYGRLNDGMIVRHRSDQDDPTYTYFKKNDNPQDVVYRQKAKLDVQNPIIGTLLDQINKSKVDYKRIKSALDKALNPKDIELEERYRKLIGDDKEKTIPPPPPPSSPNLPSLPPSPPPGPSPFLPPPPPPPQPPFYQFPPPPTDSYDYDLIRPERENYFPLSARMPGSKKYDDDPCDDDFFMSPSPEHEQVNLDANLLNIFPDADRVLDAEENGTNKNVAYEEISSALERGEIPKELDFFTGDQNKYFQNKLDSLDLNEDNKIFRDYLMSEDCKNVLECNNIKIHIDSGDIFIGDQNTNESLYDFLQNQQNEKKKQLPIDFSYDDDYTDYITKYLPSIRDVDDDKFDVLTNKNAKYLFHLFNRFWKIKISLSN